MNEPEKAAVDGSDGSKSSAEPVMDGERLRPDEGRFDGTFGDPGQSPPVESGAGTTGHGGPAGAGLESKIPPAVRLVMGHYLTVARNVLISPRVFFAEMENTRGFTEPATFLAISVGLNSVLTALLNGFNLLGIPRSIIGESVACLVSSGLSYMLAKGMGSKCSFENTFKVFAYCSCLVVLAPIPGIGFVAPIYGLVLNFFGLKQVLKVTVYQTATIMFLICFLQVIIALGRMMGH